MSDNHFISVSRAGVLLARPKGGAPVAIATCEGGLATPSPLGPLRVFFDRSGANRHVHVIAVEVDGERLDVDAFLARPGATAEDLGRWMRAAVDAAVAAAQAGD
ncbi:MAG: hypothetical protein H6706_03695 [Myxococcales bacterium]|nr:hypothetical protein [Myxococcales bacterium]